MAFIQWVPLPAALTWMEMRITFDLPRVLRPWPGSRRIFMVLSGDSSGIPGTKVGKFIIFAAH